MEENVDRPYQYHYLHFYSILVNLSIADYHIRKLKIVRDCTTMVYTNQHFPVTFGGKGYIEEYVLEL